MPIAYYGYKLSDNIIENPNDGTLVCRNAIIARTGFQEYKAKELPQSQIKALELQFSPEDIVKVFRQEDEVFSATTIASFEGKPLTDGHPPQLLDIDTIADFQTGHIQNVRRGKEPLDSGDWPLLSDLIVTDPRLIEKIQKFGLRELSCGYNYNLAVKSGNVCQVEIRGNHVAVVENGRAGNLVGIQDEMPKLEIEQEKSKMNFRKLWLAIGMKAWAEKAKPEEIAAAMDEAAKEEKEETKAAEDSKTVDSGKGKDAKALDRERFHTALDRMLDGKEKEQAAQDADLDALKGLFGEKSEAADTKDGKGEDEDLKTFEESEAADEESNEAEDEAVESEAATKIPAEARTKPDVAAAVDAAYVEGQREMLKRFRPFVARTNNPALKGAFDTAVTALRGTQGGSKGGYAAFTAALSKGKGMDADPTDGEAQRCKAMDDAYATARGSYRSVKK